MAIVRGEVGQGGMPGLSGEKGQRGDSGWCKNELYHLFQTSL